jgi:shikimate dehydrogenase
MYPKVDEAPQMDYSLLTPFHYLFDLVYNPVTTRFLELGAQQGAHTLSGIDMLYAQAEAAWNIWTKE